MFVEYKTKTSITSLNLFFFFFPICNNLFIHLSYIWPIVQFLAENGVAAVAKKTSSTTNL